MTDIPDEAVTAAKISDNKYNRERTMPNISDDRIRNFLRAAAPHLLAAGVAAHRAEQDAVHADLSQLLRVLGMGDHARPQSSHEVMLEAISEAGRIRLALERAEVLLAERDRQWAEALRENERLLRKLTELEGDSDG